jgi:hypothetical protein
MTWDTAVLAFSGPATAVVFAGLTRLFRAAESDAVKSQIAESMRGEFAVFRVGLAADLDKTYVRAGECGILHTAIAQRLDNIDERLRQVHSFTGTLRPGELRREYDAG